MTVEELLKPRYEVVADYPGSPCKVGDILECSKDVRGNDIIMIDDTGGYSLEWFAKFPHLFRHMRWWEKRAIEDMPEYVKWGSATQKVAKVERFIPIMNAHEIQDWKIKLEDRSISHFIWRYTWIQPATESEYLTFKNQPK